MALRIAVVGGTGMYALPRAEAIDVETPYGDVALQYARARGKEVFFLPRHGPGHTAAAHAINHRANVAALASARVDYVFAVNNCGALSSELQPGSFVVLRDFLDFHRRGPWTFHGEAPVHVSMLEPYCPTASAALGKVLGASRPAIYAGVDGPRFETAAEIRHLRSAGAHVVGMTGVPEAVLAREKGLCYAALAFVGNRAGETDRAGGARRIQARLARAQRRAWDLIEAAVKGLAGKKTCRCAAANENALLLTPRGIRS